MEEWKIYKKSWTNQFHVSKKIYEVSNYGRVKKNGCIIKPTMCGKYQFIGGFYIHRAVAELFVPNPENKPSIDHIDTNRLNNRAENLRWVTQKENMNNPLTKANRTGKKRGPYKKTNVCV